MRHEKVAALGRVYSVLPSQSERFYLRLLLHHVRGPTSFQDLKTVDGVTKTNLSSQDRGLLENDHQWDTILREASISERPLKLRELFAVIIILFPLRTSQIMGHFKGQDYDVCNEDLKRLKTNFWN